jgi:hypothetical protein
MVRSAMEATAVVRSILLVAAPVDYAQTCKSRAVLYVRVFKANTEGICRLLAARQPRRRKASNATDLIANLSAYPLPVGLGAAGVVPAESAPNFTFTFVREPLERFISGYSEVSFRARTGQRYTYGRCRRCYSFLDQASDDERALAFVEDYVHGRVQNQTCCPLTASNGDLHVAPQAAFLLAALQGRLTERIDFVGRLETFEADWLAVQARVPHFPRFQKAVESRQTHLETNALSNSSARAAMERLLRGANGTLPTLRAPLRHQLCALLRVDYDCFGYTLPRLCKDATDSPATVPRGEDCVVPHERVALPDASRIHGRRSASERDSKQ